MKSKRFTLNQDDLQAQLRSAIVFLAPSILAFLAVLTPAVNSLVPETTEKMILLVVIKWVLDQVTGLVRKFVAGKK